MMNMMTKMKIVNMTRIRLIVSSTDISEEAELRLTSMLNETIKNYWVALGNDEKEDECAYHHYFRAPELRKEYRVEARGRPLGGHQMMMRDHDYRDVCDDNATITITVIINIVQVSEGLYSDSTRGIYLLCLILQVFVSTLSPLCLHFVFTLFTLSSLCLHFVFTLSSLCLHFVFTLSSFCLHFVFPLSSLSPLCLHSVSTLSSLCLHQRFNDRGC